MKNTAAVTHFQRSAGPAGRAEVAAAGLAARFIADAADLDSDHGFDLPGPSAGLGRWSGDPGELPAPLPIPHATIVD